MSARSVSGCCQKDADRPAVVLSSVIYRICVLCKDFNKSLQALGTAD